MYIIPISATCTWITNLYVFQVNQKVIEDAVEKAKRVLDEQPKPYTPVDVMTRPVSFPPCNYVEKIIPMDTGEKLSNILEEKSVYIPNDNIHFPAVNIDLKQDIQHRSYSMATNNEPVYVQSCKREILFCEEKQIPFLQQKTIETKCGEIIFPQIQKHQLETHVNSCNSTANVNISRKYTTDFVESHKQQKKLPTVDIIGDNVDIFRTPSKMTKERQNKSWHWFLNMGVQRRVVSDLPDQGTKDDILNVQNNLFLPSEEDCSMLDNNMAYHIVKVMTSYIKCLKPYVESVPKCIVHPHIKETSQKSHHTILHLLDKSENKSDDMITILESIHQEYIAHTEEQAPEVIKKKIFGGDVLTNERAYSAQLAMMNVESDFFRLGGLIHRPEGLHRMMNFLLVSIYSV